MVFRISTKGSSWSGAKPFGLPRPVAYRGCSQDSWVLVPTVVPSANLNWYLGWSALSTNARCNPCLPTSDMITSPTANGGPGFRTIGPPRSCTSTPPRPRNVASDAHEVTVSSSVRGSAYSVPAPQPNPSPKSNCQTPPSSPPLSSTRWMSGLSTVIILSGLSGGRARFTVLSSS